MRFPLPSEENVAWEFSTILEGMIDFRFSIINMILRRIHIQGQLSTSPMRWLKRSLSETINSSSIIPAAGSNRFILLGFYCQSGSFAGSLVSARPKHRFYVFTLTDNQSELLLRMEISVEQFSIKNKGEHEHGRSCKKAGGVLLQRRMDEG